MIEENISSDNNDLSSAVKESLERKGVIRDVKARLRASVFKCLEDKSVPLPVKNSKDIHLSIELVREFLRSLDLESTLSVFCEEIGQPVEMRCDREFIAGELGFNILTQGETDRTTPIPLLCQLVQQLRLDKSKYENDMQS
jgi:lisH domain-containing protein FOPNL